MARLNPYLHFAGNCQEAMTFYQACLGGELNVQTIGDTPMAEQMPEEARKQVIHSMLTAEGIVIFASDMIHGDSVVRGNSMTMCLNCNSEEEISTLFANLAEGGQVSEPLRTEFWGGTFGSLTDKYGVNWMFNYDKNAQQ